jgi:hypothetical protein
MLSRIVSGINFLDNSVYFSAFSKKDTGFKIRKLACSTVNLDLR